MAFVLQTISSINNFFFFYENGVDKIFSNIRYEADKSYSVMQMFASTVMYVALVVLTCTFTIQYLKRVIYMAFLTMIAPLICLTYPLDKIKDGQAQALSMWLREYIFNAFMTNYIAIAIVVDGNVRITVTVFVLSLQESDEFVFQTIRDVYIA